MPNKYQNGRNAYILILQDQFAKKVALEPMKKKNKEESARALKVAFKRLTNNFATAPRLLTHDKGNEFLCKPVKDFLRKHGIEQRTISTGFKAAICERTIRQIKLIINRYQTLKATKSWLPIIKNVEDKYNSTVHHTTKYRPIDIDNSNAELAFSNMYKHLTRYVKRKPCKYKVGDRVRIAEKMKVFSKKYLPMFSKQIYIVKKIKPTFPVYSIRVETQSGEEVDKTFVQEELSYADN